MRSPRDLYEVVDELSQALRLRGQDNRVGPVLVVALKGFIDAGNVGTIVVDHLLKSSQARRFITFDHDELVDYRAKRPMMTFDTNRWTDYAEPELVIDLLTDTEGTEFLLLHGVEPDRYWNAFISALLDLILEYNISLVVSAAGIPMGIPHTRPLSVTMHGSNEALLGDEKPWMNQVQVPASVANLLEYRIGDCDVDAVGIAVHVPHYLAQSQYPPAAIVGLSRVEAITGMNFGVEELAEPAQESLEEVTRQIAQSAEAQEMVTALENQYDAFMSARVSDSLLATEQMIPSADELGAEFERFLAQQDEDGPGAQSR